MDLVALDAAITTGRLNHWPLRRVGRLVHQLPRLQLAAFDRQLKLGQEITVALIVAREVKA
jgi:hypothetical protein